MVESRERKAGEEEGLGCEEVGGKRWMGPTEETKAVIRVWWVRERYFSAMPAAATRPFWGLVVSKRMWFER